MISDDNGNPSQPIGVLFYDNSFGREFFGGLCLLWGNIKKKNLRISSANRIMRRCCVPLAMLANVGLAQTGVACEV